MWAPTLYAMDPETASNLLRPDAAASTGIGAGAGTGDNQPLFDHRMPQSEAQPGVNPQTRFNTQYNPQLDSQTPYANGYNNGYDQAVAEQQAKNKNAFANGYAQAYADQQAVNTPACSENMNAFANGYGQGCADQHTYHAQVFANGYRKACIEQQCQYIPQPAANPSATNGPVSSNLQGLINGGVHVERIPKAPIKETIVPVVIVAVGKYKSGLEYERNKIVYEVPNIYMKKHKQTGLHINSHIIDTKPNNHAGKSKHNPPAVKE